MANAVLSGQLFALGISDVGDEKLQASTLNIFNGSTGLFLQRDADRTIRIVNLHDRRRSVSNPAQVVLANGRLHVTDSKPATAAENRDGNAAITQLAQDVTA